MCGKTTAAKKIVKFLNKKGRDVLITARPNKIDEPGLTMYNEAKKDKYEGSMARYMLFAANNALNFHNNILPWVKANPYGIVLSDRFVISALAYNIINTPLEARISEIMEVENLCCDNFRPDICFYLYSGKKRTDPYNALKNRKNKLESNDLRNKKFKLELIKKYEKAVKYYNEEFDDVIYSIDIDNPNFMKLIKLQLSYHII